MNEAALEQYMLASCNIIEVAILLHCLPRTARDLFVGVRGSKSALTSGPRH